jgi:hypothetical protein
LLMVGMLWWFCQNFMEFLRYLKIHRLNVEYLRTCRLFCQIEDEVLRVQWSGLRKRWLIINLLNA